MFRRRCHGIGSPMSLLGAKFLGPEGDVHGTPLTIAELGLVNTEQRYDHRTAGGAVPHCRPFRPPAMSTVHSGPLSRLIKIGVGDLS